MSLLNEDLQWTESTFWKTHQSTEQGYVVQGLCGKYLATDREWECTENVCIMESKEGRYGIRSYWRFRPDFIFLSKSRLNLQWLLPLTHNIWFFHISTFSPHPQYMVFPYIHILYQFIRHFQNKILHYTAQITIRNRLDIYSII